MAGKRLYGLVGYPLGHSFSERYFREKFARENITDAEYRNFPLGLAEDILRLTLRHPDLRGLSVTIPHKTAVIPFLGRVDPEAAKIGAVNCIKVGRDGSMTGYNTDAAAFRESLLGLIGDDRPGALILGSGGAARAVAYVLDELGISHSVVSRSGKGMLKYDGLTDGMIEDNRLVINATPLGTWPDTDVCPPIPYRALTPRHYLFDLVYNPAETVFMRRGAAKGARTMNGYGMLVRQAELSWTIWNGTT